MSAPLPSLPTDTDLCIFSIVSVFFSPEVLIIGILQYVAFLYWLLSLSHSHLRFITWCSKSYRYDRLLNLAKGLFKLKFKFPWRRLVMDLTKEYQDCGKEIRQLLTYKSQLLLFSDSGGSWVDILGVRNGSLLFPRGGRRVGSHWPASGES